MDSVAYAHMHNFFPPNRLLQGDVHDKDGKVDSGPEFAQIFLALTLGAVVVTLNSKLLGGNVWVAEKDEKTKITLLLPVENHFLSTPCSCTSIASSLTAATNVH